MKGRDCSKRGGRLHIYIIQKGKGQFGCCPLTADRFLSGSLGGKEKKKKKKRGDGLLLFGYRIFFIYEIGSLDIAQADPTTTVSDLSSTGFSFLDHSTYSIDLS
jgi:hypothetical protein